MAIEELGRYKIEGKLGEGAMGVVYAARDPLLDRVVAIKTIKLDLTAGEMSDFERRFFREAKSAARLKHPAIVTIHDAGKVGDVAYITMELLEGKDLRQLIGGDKRPDFDRIADIIARVADGLDYAHNNGVVHRDIKPANIMILDNGQVKIADFGIAQLQTGTMTMVGAILGTPRYMSPEQITGGAVDGRSDVFSLGVVLYQFLTGVAPFDGGTVSNIMYRILNEPAMKPSTLAAGVPRGFDYVLAKALAKDPAKRYATAGEMAADLRRYRELCDMPHLPWQDGGLGEADEVPPRAAAVGGFSARGTMIMGLDNHTDDGEVWSLGDTGRTPGQAAEVGAADDPAANSPDASAERGRSKWIPAWIALAVLVVAGIGVALMPRDIGGSANVSLAVTPWGEVFVDGDSKGIAPPLRELKLPAGRHRLEIRNGDATPMTVDLDLHDGETRKIKHKF